MSRPRKAGLAVLALGAGGLGLADAWPAFGGAPGGDRLARMQASPQWSGGGFTNPEPLWNDTLGMLRTMFSPMPFTSPEGELPVQRADRSRFAPAPASGLRITWLGHSTQIIELDGATLLTDPIFGGRASPVGWAGPAVWYPPPLPLAELPPLDAVLISHDHYDHLQVETIQALGQTGVRFIVPLGVGAHLESWGVAPGTITEVDWWDPVEVGDITVHAVPARHASGRQVLDQNRTLWSGYALVGPRHRVWFSGDTGLFPDMEAIGARLGPFDATLIEVGAYDQAWPDWHLGPEQAVRAHRMARGDLFVPVHWGLWSLASHGWTEPAERVLAEAEARGVRAFVPRPGESFEPAVVGGPERWWPDHPWRTAAAYPIEATRVPPEAD